MTICDNCIHKNVCSDERHYDEALSFCADKTAERPHGKWKTIEGFDGDEYYECSNCGEPWILMAGTPKDNSMNFCPVCGADMREAE